MQYGMQHCTQNWMQYQIQKWHKNRNNTRCYIGLKHRCKKDINQDATLGTNLDAKYDVKQDETLGTDMDTKKDVKQDAKLDEKRDATL